MVFSDGVNWQQVTASADWSPRHSFVAEVFNNRMWVIGPESVPGLPAMDQPGPKTQPPYHGLSSEQKSLVFHNKLWMIGGCTPNDLHKFG